MSQQYMRPERREVVIAQGQTKSGPIHIGHYRIAGLLLPAALTSSSITFEVADEKNGTYVPLYDSDGNQVSASVAASRGVGLSGMEADAFAAFEWCKLVMDLAEGAERTIILRLK